MSDLNPYNGLGSGSGDDGLSGDMSNLFKGLFGGLGANKSKFDEALANDKRIRSLAYYATTKGQTEIPDPTKPEAAKEYLKIYDAKFKELKALVKRGSFTLDELEDQIAIEYGVVNDLPEDRLKLKGALGESDETDETDPSQEI